ncbi:MAG: glycosyltransferase family 2 protein [Bacteroidetes bacterium]|nr:glycosyltransferase family 2 protein [Bacteroidota bacterium]
MSSPKVSVIIVNYNTYTLTRACIASVIRFTKEISFEIILVDNGSTEKKEGEFLKEFPGVIYLHSEKNSGFASGNNIGIAKANGEIILLLNSDTELKEDSISYCYKKLNEEEQTAVLTCMLIFPNGEIQHQCQRFPSLFREFLLATRLIRCFWRASRGKYFLGVWFDHLSPRSVDSVWGTFFMFRKKELDIFSNKKLPETYFMYEEDVEWCYAFRKRGKNIFYDPGTKVVHHMGGSVMEDKMQKMFVNEKDFIIRNHGKFYWKCWKFFRLLNYRISKRNNPLYEGLYEVLRKIV